MFAGDRIGVVGIFAVDKVARVLGYLCPGRRTGGPFQLIGGSGGRRRPDLLVCGSWSADGRICGPGGQKRRREVREDKRKRRICTFRLRNAIPLRPSGVESPCKQDPGARLSVPLKALLDLSPASLQCHSPDISADDPPLCMLSGAAFIGASTAFFIRP